MRRTESLLVIAGLMLQACGGPQIAGRRIEIVREVAVSVEDGCFDVPGDPLEVLGTELSDEALRILVRYDGGCEEHRFVLCPSNRILSIDPPQQDFIVMHDAKGDDCRAVQGLALRIDRRELPDIAKVGRLLRQGFRATLKSR